MRTKPASENNCFIEIGDGENFGFKNNEFDLVYSYHTLKRVSDPIKDLF
jgi:hypothetical protein